MYFICQHDDNPATTRLGLCCINNALRKKNIFCSRTLIAKTYTLDRAKECATRNLADLRTLLEWNCDNGISHYRLSSDMFPRITDSEIDPSQRLKISDFADTLADLGKFVRETGQRITMHPGQYNQIGAIDQGVLDRTIEDLSIHAEILNYMGLDDNAILTIHGGGVYGDKEKTIRRWLEQFDDMPGEVKSRIAIENCERQYNIKDVLFISDEAKIPVIFDSHHIDCYNLIHDTDFCGADYIPHVLHSWGDRRMVCHISEQKPGARIGSHSDYIETIPDYFLSIPEMYGVGVDIEVEAKAKEAAIFKLKTKYSL